MLARAWGEPMAASSARHCLVVLESRQIGELGILKASFWDQTNKKKHNQRSLSEKKKLCGTLSSNLELAGQGSGGLQCLQLRPGAFGPIPEHQPAMSPQFHRLLVRFLFFPSSFHFRFLLVFIFPFAPPLSFSSFFLLFYF
jgi:hypothetical protein